jgi:predicted amidophosphoribosyltransferase
MNPLTVFTDALLELLAPERCAHCSQARAELADPDQGWARGLPGPAPGLHRWHEPHLCAACLDHWRRPAVRGVVAGRPLIAALPESDGLVRVVGTWKYRGVRGLARPLAALLVPPLRELLHRWPDARLVPVPLHPRRHRERGFDQCRQLAVLAGRAVGSAVATGLLARRRGTAQQASRPVDGDERRRNVAKAFAARLPAAGEPDRLILLDDLATSGATLAAATAAAEIAGWRVEALVALGCAGRLRHGSGLTGEGMHR